MYEVPEEMRQELLTHIPLGTNVETARSVMQQNGFDCSDQADKDSGAPHLYCDKSQ